MKQRLTRVYLKIGPQAQFMIDDTHLTPDIQIALTTLQAQIRAAISYDTINIVAQLSLIIDSYKRMYNLDVKQAVIDFASQEFTILLNQKFNTIKDK